jgi:sigma-B regulation protein RsbU (phosphoserine phosphatase)
MKTAPYAESRRAIEPGQVIVIGTDGIWEARNPQGDYFGKNRLMALVKGQADQPAAAIAGSIIKALDDFRQSRPPEDDATLIVIRITG